MNENEIGRFVRLLKSERPQTPLLLLFPLLHFSPKAPEVSTMIGTSIGIALLSFYCLHPATSPFFPILLIASLSCSLKLFLVRSNCLLASLILITKKYRMYRDLDSLNLVSRSFLDSTLVHCSGSYSPIPALPLSSPSPKQS